ncbi:replicative DNA helicase [bacterium]|nr:replicative DNA helicase [bacterium]
MDLNLMPQDIQAEEAVLGAILVNPSSVMTKVVEILKPESFYKPAHRYVFEAMLQLFNQNQMIDIVSVSDVLSYSSRLEMVGGRAFVNDLAFKTVTTANVAYYAKIIQEKAIKRALINAGSEIVQSGYNVDNVDTSLEQAEKLIFDISSQKSTKDFVPVKDDVLNVYNKIEYRYQHRDECTGVQTHFYDLDTMTNGLQKSDLIILAARPSMGKTAFALNIVANVAMKSKVPVAMFSLEMSREQLVQRMMCSEAEVDSQRLRSGNMQSKDWEKLINVMSEFAEASIYIDDTAGCTLTDIRAKCRRLAMEEKNLGLVVIDYLQLINSSNANNDRNQEISAISRGLKILARELNVPIIALSQLSRKVEDRGDKRPMLSDLRDSGAIEQDADIVMFIHREDYYNKDKEEDGEVNKSADSKGKSDIIIAKQRNGPVGDIQLLFQANITKFKNPIKTDVF